MINKRNDDIPSPTNNMHLLTNNIFNHSKYFSVFRNNKEFHLRKYNNISQDLNSQNKNNANHIRQSPNPTKHNKLHLNLTNVNQSTDNDYDAMIKNAFPVIKHHRTPESNKLNETAKNNNQPTYNLNRRYSGGGAFNLNYNNNPIRQNYQNYQNITENKYISIFIYF